jgi:hypothetical protein
MQTYAVADYDNSGIIVPGDVTVLAHEVGEWMDDPYTNNPTRPWGHIGQVTNCQTNLEVGDPLTGKSLTVSMNGFKYHPQELAFFSWFYRQSPSLVVNGLYSNNGPFSCTTRHRNRAAHPIRIRIPIQPQRPANQKNRARTAR